MSRGTIARRKDIVVIRSFLGFHYSGQEESFHAAYKSKSRSIITAATALWQEDFVESSFLKGTVWGYGVIGRSAHAPLTGMNIPKGYWPRCQLETSQWSATRFR